MIATFLQDDLKADLEETFKHFFLKDPQGKLVNLNIFKQNLPIPVAAEMPETVTDEELEEGIYDAIAKEDPGPQGRPEHYKEDLRAVREERDPGQKVRMHHADRMGAAGRRILPVFLRRHGVTV